MAELTPKERLQPALLDRLRDDEPDKTQEAREQRVLSMRQLRESVLRDLRWLLNTGNLATTGELEHHPLITRSVLNFGIPDLSGTTATAMRGKLEAMIRDAIIAFEPRILKESLRVRAFEADQMNRNTINLEIRGELWGQPLPTLLYLRSEIDFETGDVTVQETGPIASR